MAGRWGRSAYAAAAAALLCSTAAAQLALSEPPAVSGRPADSDRISRLDLAALAAEIAAGRLTSEQAVAASLDRIDRIDRAGPTLRAVVALNPDAIADARALDAERRAGRLRGPLHGVPILIKDNIETRGPMPTTAGSAALAQNVAREDAELVARLRAAGAVILGKTNMSEWAGYRDSNSVSGWSGLGGRTLNPHVLDRSPCGSSSGSAVAVAAELAAGAVGTETSGSISCPASMTGVVGFKPTRGRVPTRGLVPVAPSFDTPGVFARDVRGAALLTGVLSDGAAPALDGGYLRGRRVGLPVAFLGDNQDLVDLVASATAALERAGAVVVLIKAPPADDGLKAAEKAVVLAELHAGLDAYLGAAPREVGVRSLAVLIAFNTQMEAEAPFGQNILRSALQAPGMGSPDYAAARQAALSLSARRLEELMDAADVDILVAPTQGPAFIPDDVLGDHLMGDGVGEAGWLAALAGWPHLTAPMGAVDSLPVGLSFIGRPGRDADVLSAGHAYEQAAHARVRPRFLPNIAVARRAAGRVGAP